MVRLMSTERLNKLQSEYEQTQKDLNFPLSFEDRDQLNEHLKAIVREARSLAQKFSIAVDYWFSKPVN